MVPVGLASIGLLATAAHMASLSVEQTLRFSKLFSTPVQPNSCYLKLEFRQCNVAAFQMSIPLSLAMDELPMKVACGLTNGLLLEIATSATDNRKRSGFASQEFQPWPACLTLSLNKF
jgi:hypothetical protein